MDSLHQRPSISSSVATVDDLDWNQLDLALDKYTHVFELPSVHDTPGTMHAGFQPKPDPAAGSPQFGQIPFPQSPSDDAGIFIGGDMGLYAGDMLSMQHFSQRQPLFDHNYPVFPVDHDPSAYPDNLIDSPSDPFLLDSPWMSAAVPDNPVMGGSPTFAPALSSGSLPAPQAIRPLMLAHRTSLPISIPSSPYRQQRFMQHSAPAAYSPIRLMHERRHSTMAAPDDAPRKRKRTPDLLEKEKDKGESAPMLSGGLPPCAPFNPAAPSDLFACLGPPQRSELHPPKQAPSTWQVCVSSRLSRAVPPLTFCLPRCSSPIGSRTTGPVIRGCVATGTCERDIEADSMRFCTISSA